MDIHRHVIEDQRAPSTDKTWNTTINHGICIVIRCHVNSMTFTAGYTRRDEDARSSPSLRWLMFCLSFCRDALSVMLIWKHTGTVQPQPQCVQWCDPGTIMWSRNNNVIQVQWCDSGTMMWLRGTCGGRPLPLQGWSLFSAACSVHEDFLLFPGPSGMWHHSSVTWSKSDEWEDM